MLLYVKEKMQNEGTIMNDMICVFLDYDIDNLEERFGIEKEIQYLDELVEKYGWRYSGLANTYIPIVRETREETVGKVVEAIASDERLKRYSPKIMNSTLTNACALGEIDLQHMVKPGDIKYSRYERYYLENNELPHGIIVDENKQIRDGYISYLLAKKYGCEVDVIEVPKKSAISKLVIGHHVKYDREQNTYVTKTSRRYAWIYKLKEAVVVGDILLVKTSKGHAYMQVEKITNIAGKNMISKHKKVTNNITALK